jgi:hypothetical protein
MTNEPDENPPHRQRRSYPQPPPPPPLAITTVRRERARQVSKSWWKAFWSKDRSLGEWLLIGGATGFVVALLLAVLMSAFLYIRAANSEPRDWLILHYSSASDYARSILSVSITCFIPGMCMAGSALGAVAGVIFGVFRDIHRRSGHGSDSQ